MFKKANSAHVQSFREAINSIRKLSLEQRAALNKEKGLECSNKRVEFLGVEWHNIAHSNEINLTRDLQSVTLPGIKFFRDFGNEIFVDLIVYMTPEFRNRILSHVCKRISRIYK